jgi:hypothetical protein
MVDSGWQTEAKAFLVPSPWLCGKSIDRVSDRKKQNLVGLPQNERQGAGFGANRFRTHAASSTVSGGSSSCD